MKAVRPLLPLVWTLFFLVPAAYLVAILVELVYEVPLAEGSFRFEREWAGLLIFGALLVLLSRGWVQHRSRPRLRISRAHQLAQGQAGLRIWLAHSTTGMRVTALTLMAIALMGPQSIHARDSAEVEGIDIVLTLDMSLSMQAADIQPNRFEATQHVVEDFVSRRPNDRIGAVVFGRDAYTLMPLTTDKEALRGVIRDLRLELIDGRGTAIGNALGVSLNRLRRSEAESKIVILLTDGDSNAGNVTPDQAAELATTMGVQVYTILMGESDRARVGRGQGLVGQIWDVGEFPINPELLRGIAERTGGRFYSVNDRSALIHSFHEILDQLERSEMEDPGRVYGELFGAFVWPALALLLLELLLGTFVLRRWP